jgi:hypothetical protein
MTPDQIQDHVDFQRREMGGDDRDDTAWFTWIAQVERLTGMASLDGDNSERAKAAGTADGYSIDECHDWFEAGFSPSQAARRVLIGAARALS